VAKRVDYGQEKRQRELEKQKKKEKKQKEKVERRERKSDAPALGSVTRPSAPRPDGTNGPRTR
jgi:hypothetical protein